MYNYGANVLKSQPKGVNMDGGHRSWFQKWRMKRLGMPISAGFETREGWQGYLRFYFFYCAKCRLFVKNYPSGHEEQLCCPLCGEYPYLHKWRDWALVPFSLVLWPIIKILEAGVKSKPAPMA